MQVELIWSNEVLNGCFANSTFCDLTAQPIHMLFLNGLFSSFWTQVEMEISCGDGASESEVQINRLQFKQEDSLILFVFELLLLPVYPFSQKD